MTCYQRIHEVILGVTRPVRPVDWDAIFWDWRGFTDLHDRDHMLGRMGVDPIDDLPLSGRRSPRVHRPDHLPARRPGAALPRAREDPRLPGRRQGGRVQRRALPRVAARRPWHDPCRYRARRRHRRVDAVPSIRSWPISPSRILAQASCTATTRHRPGAEVLASLPGGQAVVYVDRASTGGTILAHAGVNLTSYMRERGRSARSCRA